MTFQDARLSAVVSDEAQLEFKDMQQIALGLQNDDEWKPVGSLTDQHHVAP